MPTLKPLRKTYDRLPVEGRVEYVNNLVDLTAKALIGASVFGTWAASQLAKTSGLAGALATGAAMFFLGLAVGVLVTRRLTPADPADLYGYLRAVDDQVDEAVCRAVCHVSCHGHDFEDHDHRVISESHHCALDGDRNYFAIRTRDMRVLPGRISKGFWVHAASRGTRVERDEMALVAWDVETGRPLRVEAKVDASPCKLWFVHFPSPRVAGARCHVRLAYTWPRANDPRLCTDGVSIQALGEGQITVNYHIALPGHIRRRRVFDGAELLGGERGTDETISFSGQLKHGALWVQWDLEPLKADLRTLEEMLAVRKATPDDLDQVYAIEQASENNEPTSRESLDERLVTFRRGFLVCTLHDQVVGFLQLTRWTDPVYQTLLEHRPFTDSFDAAGNVLTGIYMSVLLPFRGHGVATLLLRQAQRLAQELQIARIHMIAWPGTEALFKSCGFQRKKKIRGYARGVDHNLMVWENRAAKGTGKERRTATSHPQDPMLTIKPGRRRRTAKSLLGFRRLDVVRRRRRTRAA